eukprot:365347-Chlamydomonas_euryale.AAC.22
MYHDASLGPTQPTQQQIKWSFPEQRRFYILHPSVWHLRLPLLSMSGAVSQTSGAVPRVNGSRQGTGGLLLLSQRLHTASMLHADCLPQQSCSGFRNVNKTAN